MMKLDFLKHFGAVESATEAAVVRLQQWAMY